MPDLSIMLELCSILETLTWSRIVLSSILVIWIASFPVILLGKKGAGGDDCY